MSSWKKNRAFRSSQPTWSPVSKAPARPAAASPSKPKTPYEFWVALFSSNMNPRAAAKPFAPVVFTGHGVDHTGPTLEFCSGNLRGRVVFQPATEDIRFVFRESPPEGFQSFLVIAVLNFLLAKDRFPLFLETLNRLELGRPWVAALEILDAAQSGALDEPIAHSHIPVNPSREFKIYVIVDFDHDVLRLYTSRILKSGGWGASKPLTVGQFSVRGEVRDIGMIPPSILRVFAEAQFYGSDTARLTPKNLLHLVGYPELYELNTPKTPDFRFEIERAVVELRLDPQGDDWQLSASLAGFRRDEFDTSFMRDSSSDAFVLFQRAKRRAVCCQMSDQLGELFDSLKKPVLVPREKRVAIVNGLTRFANEATLTLPNIEAVHVAEPPRFKLDIERQPNGAAQVALKVERGGKLQVPGARAKPVYVEEEGRIVRKSFNTSHERERAETLKKELALDKLGDLSSDAWVIDSPDRLFDFVEKITPAVEQHADVDVSWSGSDASPLVYVGELTESAMRLEVDHDRDWFGLSGTFDLDGCQVKLMAVIQALSTGSRLVALDNGRFARIGDDLFERLAKVAMLLHRNRDRLEFDITAAPALNDLLVDDKVIKAAAEWRALVGRLAKLRTFVPRLPNTFVGDLRDYQKAGFSWMRRLAEWGVGGILADDMGLGKTVQTIAVLCDRSEIGPALVVCPTSVAFNWCDEIRRFAPGLEPVMYRDVPRREFLTTLSDRHVVVTSYALARQHEKDLATVTWGTLVIDEAQFVKNAETHSARAMRDLPAIWKIALTGTPVENHLGELWSLFRIVAPGLFGSHERFRECFSGPIEKENSLDHRKALASAIQPFVLRRLKQDVLKELPPRTEIQLTAELSATERRLYEDARLVAAQQAANLETQGTENIRIEILALLTRLRQLACHPALVDKAWKKSSAKLDLLIETVLELKKNGHRALVFSQFTSHLALVRKALDKHKFSYQYIDGSTPSKLRQERVAEFQAGQGDLFLISLKAGGTGLNLTAADYVLHLDPWWNPAVEDQATDRTHRIGQTKPVTVYRLVTKGTIEEQILKLHGTKRELVASLLDGSDHAGKLSTNELIDLIRGSTATAHAPKKKLAKAAT